MSKYRIYELAKEFNTSSKIIIDILARHNIQAKNHMSSVDDDVKNILTKTFAHKDVAKPVTKEEPKQKPVPATHSNNHHSSAPSHTASAQQQTVGGQGKREQNQNHNPNYGHNRGQNNSQNRGQNNSPNNSQNNQQRYNHNTQRNAPQQQTRPATQRPQSQQYNSRPNAAAQQGQRPQTTNRNGQSSGQNFQHKKNNSTPVTASSDRNQRSAKPHTESRPQNSNRFQHGGPKNQFGNNKKHQPRHQNNNMKTNNTTSRPEPPKPKSIKIGSTITVKDLATLMFREVSEIIKKLMMLGTMANINQEIDFDTATIVAGEFGVTVAELPPEVDPTEIPEIEDDPSSLIFRPPVVTVMGHVDHGKTSLLDAIRQTHVTANEAGGITQHIGAHQVNYQGKKIVFLDTPGHEAFTAMRARGAQVTDIAILVVAADDGVMPQTIEAINHAKSAKVPIIVAINKMDRPNATPDRVKQQLAEYNLIPEDWGGDTIMVEVSAYQKTGISDLLEMILLVAEMQDLKANPNRDAVGTIIEAQLDKGRGPVATVLVQKGTLHIGDTIIAGTAYGKVRAMVNDRGDKVKKATPATAVEVLGLSEVPQAGDILVSTDEKIARSVAESRIAKHRSEELSSSQKVSLDDLFKQIQEGNLKDLNIVVKADVQGSIEALRQALVSIKNDQVRVIVVHAGVGAINESDVMLASASNALILGFNVRPDNNARKAAETEKIDIRTYRVIYDAINDMEAAIKGMLAPEFKEVIQGRVEVRKVFTISKVLIAGCYVLEGKVTNSSQVRIIRDGIVIHEGQIESLRRFKDDVKEVATGYECGITLEKFRDLKEGDIIEAFTMEQVKQSS